MLADINAIASTNEVPVDASLVLPFQKCGYRLSTAPVVSSSIYRSLHGSQNRGKSIGPSMRTRACAPSVSVFTHGRQYISAQEKYPST